MSYFMAKAREALAAKLPTMPQLERDQLLGDMFPDWCPGLLIQAVKNA